MVISARGNAYEPSPAPQSGDVAALREWAGKEFGRIASALKQGRAQFLSLDNLAALPDKPFTGMLGFFKAGVAGAGEGLYEYRGGTWNKL